MTTRDEILRFVVQTEGSEGLKKTAANIDAVTTAAAAGEPKAQALVDELAQLANVGNSIKSFVRLKAELSDTGTKLANAKTELERLRDEMGRSETVSKGLQRSFNAAEREVDRLTKAENRQSVELQKLGGALSKAGVDTTKLAEADRRLNDEAQKVVRSISELADKATAAGRGARDAATGVDDLGKKAKGAQSGTDGLLGSIGKIGVLAAGIGAALKGIQLGADVFGSAVAIEQSLSRVQALAEGASDRVAQLGTKIHDAAREAKVGPEAAAAGLAALAAQGQNIDQAFASLIPTLQLAKIAQIEVGQAAGYVDDVLDLFGLSAEQAGKAVDILVTAAKGSDEGLSGLLGGLSKIAPTARDAGLSFEQTAGILGVFVQNGFSAEKAAKGLLKIFDDLRDPASTLRQNLADLGDNSGDFATAIETLAGAGSKGKATLDGLDASARNLVLFLLQQGGDAIGNFTNSLLNVEGAASKTAAAIDNNLGGAFTNAKASFDNLATAFLAPVLQPLKDEIVLVSKAVDEFSKTEAFKRLQDALVQFVTTGLAALNQFVSQIDFNAVSENLANFGTNASAFFVQFRADLESVAAFAGKVINGVGVAWDGAATVIHGAATVIASALAGIVKAAALVAKLDIAGELRAQLEGVESASAKLDELARTLWESSKTNADQTAESFRSLGENVDALANAIGTTTPVAQAGAAAIGSIGTAAAALPEQVAGAATGLQDLGTATSEIQAVAQPAAQAVQDLGTMIVTAESSLQGARDRVRETRDALVELQGSAEATPEAIAAANAEFQAATSYLETLKQSLKGSKEATDELKRAYANLGIVSQAELIDKAQKTVTAFESVERAQRSGAATAEDVKRAFVAMAEAQLTAARDSDAATRARVENELRVKAAALGVIDTLERLGIAGRTAGEEVAAGANKASAALDETAASADKAASSAANLGESSSSAASGLNSIAVAASNAGDAAFGASKEFADAATMGGKLDRVTFNLIQEQTTRYNKELDALNASNQAMDERAQLVNSLASSYNLLSAAQIQALANAKIENQQLLDKQRQRQEEQRSQSTTTSGGGTGAVTRSEVTVNVRGAAGDIRATAKDRAAVEELARALAPELERLAQRGGFRLRLS
ncbi:MAG: phage tail tape measure protein [Rhodanobacteraceae bacterium]|nr:phage tail tape measure protein [Rhodanobacteraceae bacterium]